MTRRSIFGILLAGAAVALAVPAVANARGSRGSASSVAPEEKTFTCGGEGQPKCPMQAWMKQNMAAAAASGEGPAIAKALDYVAAHAPPGFDKWQSIAKDGADKARAGDVDASKKACKTCHDLYKAKYKSEMRDRPF